VNEPAAQPATTKTIAETTGTTTLAATSPNTVEISSSSFQPNLITVPVGTTVTWINRDTKDQTVTSMSKAFDSGNIASGAQFTNTFSNPGTYDYYSTINPSMKGKVIVTGSSRKFVDVREYKDKIGPGGDLSGVPPGMSGL
jgi:plastocyanin